MACSSSKQGLTIISKHLGISSGRSRLISLPMLNISLTESEFFMRPVFRKRGMRLERIRIRLQLQLTIATQLLQAERRLC